MILRPARSDEADTLLAIQREAAVDAFAHVYPPERYPFPDDAIREVWAEALADPDVEVYVAELDGAVAFFVDEDPHRAGQTCFGRPIYRPGDAPAESQVFIALPPLLAAAVKHRLESQGLKLRFEIPGSLPSP